MDIILQAWGGAFYLLNKIFFALAEGKKQKARRQLKMAGWVIYLLGVPAWVIILVGKHDWIAASIEAGGVPSMLFGLFTVYQNAEAPNKIFDLTAAFFTYGFLIMGLCYSVYDYGGITSASQIFEMGVMVGFLIGSYLLAKSNLYGWIFFMLMNGSMGALMLIQQRPLLTVQQLLSFCFVIYGFAVSLKSTEHIR
jgi:hypothetical protein